MTIVSRDYFRLTSPARPGEPDTLAMIDRVACTSCQACALACPMACIFEVEGVGQSESGSYHAVDTSRCIGCQLCFRLVSPDGQLGDKLCPRDAIRMVPNPNVRAAVSPFRSFYQGPNRSLPWSRIEEVGRQLYLAREVRTRRDALETHPALACLVEPDWSLGRSRFSIVEPPIWEGPALLHRATADGLDLLERIFESQ